MIYLPKNRDDQPDANRDPLTSTPGAHPVGTGLGSAGGAGAGAAIGAMAGPIGAGIGAAIGGIVGGLAGKSAGEAVNPTNPDDFIGCAVLDRDNDRLGTVESVWHDGDGQPAFLAIKTGWLGLGHAHLVPAEVAEWTPKGRRIRLPYDEDVFKASPTFAAEEDLDDAGEARLYDYWRGVSPSLALPAEATASGGRLRKVSRATSPQRAITERLPSVTAVAGHEPFNDDEPFVPLRRT